MTNLPGILILGLADGQLIQIFFFRLNLLITLMGMLHGLVFLPVILSYVGESQTCFFQAVTIMMKTTTVVCALQKNSGRHKR